MELKLATNNIFPFKMFVKAKVIELAFSLTLSAKMD